MEDSTPALRAVADTSLDVEVVRTEPADSVEESADLQGIDVAHLVKTIVVRRGEDDYVFVLVPGPRVIHWPKLRALLGVSRLSLPDADEAREATGYERGAITPLGSTHAWPVVADAHVSGRIAIGGGARGVNLHVEASDLVTHLAAVIADVTKPAG